MPQGRSAMDEGEVSVTLRGWDTFKTSEVIGHTAEHTSCRHQAQPHNCTAKHMAYFYVFHIPTNIHPISGSRVLRFG
jgi:hypothetical protein